MFRKIGAALALLSFTVPAAAQELDPAAVAAGRELLEATDFHTQFEQTAQLASQTTFTTLLAGLEEQHQIDFPVALEAELRQTISEHIEELVAELRPTALEDAARIYARYFTAEEIRELQRLQTHPVMVKFQAVAPQFITELSQIGIAEAARLGPQLQQKVAKAVAAWLQSREMLEEGPST